MRKSVWEFFGSPEEIQAHWLADLRAKLLNYSSEKKQALEERLFLWPLEEGIIDEVLEGKRLLTTSVFRRLAGALGLSMRDYIKFDDENPLTEAERCAFEHEMKENGARIAFGLHDGSVDKALPALSVEAYLLMRAYCELDVEHKEDEKDERKGCLLGDKTHLASSY